MILNGIMVFDKFVSNSREFNMSPDSIKSVTFSDLAIYST